MLKYVYVNADSSTRARAIPLLAYSGLSFPLVQHLVDEVVGDGQVIELTGVECEQPRIGLLDDADLDLIDERQPLARIGPHRRTTSLGSTTSGKRSSR